MSMVAQVATRQQANWTQLDKVTGRLLESVLIFATLLSLLMVVWLLIRRAMGQLQSPLDGGTLTAVALVALGAVSGLRFTWNRCGLAIWSPLSWLSLLWAVPSLTLLLLGLALSLPGTRSTALAWFWTLLIGGDICWWYCLVRQLPSRPSEERQLVHPKPHTLGLSATEIGECLEEESLDVEEGDEELLPPGVTQQLTRSQDDDGTEIVAGLLRQPFVRGERSRSMHVAFCPPLQHRPAIDVVQITGPQVGIKAAEVHPYGVRFDLRLAKVCEQPEEILLHFEARERPSDETSTA